MALFTDFFPSAGGEINNNAATPVATGNATISALVANTSLTLTFSPDLSATPQAGDIVAFSSSGMNYTGVVIGSPTVSVVNITISQTNGLANTNAVNAAVTRGGQTIIEGDSIVGGDSHVSGDSIVQGNVTITGTHTSNGGYNGDLTGNSSTATTLQTARNIALSGDITGSASFNGSADAAITTAIAANAVDSNEIANNAVGNSEIADGAVTGVKLGNVLQTNSGLTQTNGALAVASSLAGTGLSFLNGVLNVESLDITTAHTFTTNADDAAAALAAFVTAFAAAAGSGTGQVPAGETISRGDLLVITFDADGTSQNEVYIYLGPTVTSGSAILGTNFADITNQADGVTSFTPGAGLEGSTALTGAVTANVAVNTTHLEIESDMVTISDGGVTRVKIGADAVDGTKIADDAIDSEHLVDGSVDLQHLSANSVDASKIVDGSVGSAELADDAVTASKINADIAGAGLVSNSTTGALDVGAGTNITVAADSVALSDNVSIAGTLGVTGRSTFSGIVDIDNSIDMDGTNANFTTSSNFTATAAGDATVSSGAATRVVAGNTLTLSTNGTQAAHGVDITSPGLGPIDITAGAAGITPMAGDINITSNGGTIDLSANTNTITGSNGALLSPRTASIIVSDEIRLSGTGIGTATDAEPLALVVGADGHVMTSASGGGGVGFNARELSADATLSESDDLVILLDIASNQTITLPANPTAGTSYKISNLSAYSGSGTGVWAIEPGNQRVLGQTVADTFSLDDATASFQLIFAGGTAGWVIIGAN